ncbi:CBL-interacting protein kinase 31 [Zea mays]|uniref:CBL-interacting protein kinase 31 n=1 Tax=Zea mays TaxID=4577 RepID=A0A3L6DY03_MAIZE|nr:CBL-interacting protein kinase 31 [Zea mays]
MHPPTRDGSSPPCPSHHNRAAPSPAKIGLDEEGLGGGLGGERREGDEQRAGGGEEDRRGDEEQEKQKAKTSTMSSLPSSSERSSSSARNNLTEGAYKLQFSFSGDDSRGGAYSSGGWLLAEARGGRLRSPSRRASLQHHHHPIGAAYLTSRADIILNSMQIKREICIMKLVRHPNIVRLFEVMGSKARIFIVLEYVTGGELFEIIFRNP